MGDLFLLVLAGHLLGGCQASAEATVKDQPNTVSRISRICVKHQVTRQRTTGSVPPGGIGPSASPIPLGLSPRNANQQLKAQINSCGFCARPASDSNPHPALAEFFGPAS